MFTVGTGTGTSDAAPTAPAGWTAFADAGVTTYRASQPGIEIHLFDPAPAQGTIEQWFLQRRATPPAGLSSPQFVDTTQSNGIYIAVGAAARGTTAVLLATFACAEANAGHVYAELVTPEDVSTFKASLRPAIEVVASQCVTHGSPSATANTAKPATPAKPTRTTRPENKPYEYRTTDPSRALPASQIAAIIHSWEYSGGHLNSNVWIALKDGTARSELPPVDTSEFDYAAEKQGDPKKWGQWKKAGSKYVVKFERDKDWRTPAGVSAWTFGTANEQLTGTYEYNDSQIGPFGYYRRTSITFSAGNRFSRSSSGGQAIVDPTGITPSVGTVWDDRGTATTITGPNVGGGSSHRSTSKDADRQGSYRIDGYTLELRYDSGRVEKRFFVLDPDRSSIYFNGNDHYRRKPKK